MSKIILFAKKFPQYHPKKGEPTFFPEKLCTSLGSIPFFQELRNEIANFCKNDFHPKGCTIRSGTRFKKGDYFDPRMWSGLPYRSKTVKLSNKDVLILATIDVKMDESDLMIIQGRGCSRYSFLYAMHKHDGFLNPSEMESWFIYYPNFKGFEGQIIIWNEQTLSEVSHFIHNESWPLDLHS